MAACLGALKAIIAVTGWHDGEANPPSRQPPMKQPPEYLETSKNSGATIYVNQAIVSAWLRARLLFQTLQQYSLPHQTRLWTSPSEKAYNP